MTIKYFKKFSNFISILMACVIGITIESNSELKMVLDGKYIYAALLFVIFFIFHLSFEYKLLKMMREKKIQLNLEVINNPLKRVGLIRLTLLLTGGLIVFIRHNLNSIFSYLVFAILVSFFVGAVFEIYRLFNRRY
jgi:hypothetical protein